MADVTTVIRRRLSGSLETRRNPTTQRDFVIMSDHIPIADQPAFPFTCQGPTTAPEFYYGISIRDYFAGQYLAGLATNSDEFTGKEWAKEMAKQCYIVADAMLAERIKQP